MNNILSLLFCILISVACLGQTADELNKQSIELLIKNDVKNGMPLLKKAAEAGSAEAQYNYGVFCLNGIEVSKDINVANEWFLKAAKQGWIDAQFKVAYSYASGRGWEKDDKQAFYWALKCAEQNDPECMFNVVSCYQEGVGVDKNIDSMLAWAIRLASLPDVENLQQSASITGARKNLALMYRDGDKVKKDINKSYMWFLVYNESKRDFSSSEQLNNIDVIKDIEKKIPQKGKGKIIQDAEKQIGRKLKNLSHLYILDL